MISPYSNKEMEILIENRTLSFRDQQFSFLHKSYFCFESKEQFTSTELDNQNIVQVYYQYCVLNKTTINLEITNLIKQYYPNFK